MSTFFLNILAVETTETNSAKVDLLDIIVSKGGVMMIPLAILSVIAVFLIIFYLFTIRRNSVVSDRFMTAAETMIRQRDYHGLLGFCDRYGQSVSRVTEKTLGFMTMNPSSSVNEVREVAQAEGSRQAGILNQRITYLSDIGAVAPMIGLLGTVIGMIKSFWQISLGHGESVQQMKLAEGVSEALITTAGGLVIGITSLVFYSLFRGRVQKYISELEAAATYLIALISAQATARSKQTTNDPGEEGQWTGKQSDIHSI